MWCTPDVLGLRSTTGTAPKPFGIAEKSVRWLYPGWWAADIRVVDQAPERDGNPRLRNHDEP